MHPDTFTRVKPTHDLDIYRGMDICGRDALLLITASQPITIKSTKAIDVSTGQRKDKKYALMFSLRDANYKDMFDCFCNDIINASVYQSITDKNAYLFFANRYKKWTSLFEKAPNDILSTEEIKGLIGEILVLKNILIPRLGETFALEAWMGPLSAPQDFVFENTWVEVKTISSTRESIRISSIEQLDSENDGQLVIVRLDSSNIAESKSISLNDIYNKLFHSLQNPIARTSFEEKLLEFGYCFNPRYDEIRFSLKKMELYNVTSAFPKIIRANIAPQILKLEYDISILTLEKFKIKEL